MAEALIVYRLDPQDRITEVSPNWLDFATANAAPHLRPEAVIGAPLWNFITDPDTAMLYRILLTRVREHEFPASVPLRCDAPDRRRFLTLSLHPLDGGSIEVRSRTLREEPREPIPILDPAARRDERLLRMCSWCKKVDVPDFGWTEVEIAAETLQLFEREAVPRITHGICDPCHESLKGRVDPVGA